MKSSFFVSFMLVLLLCSIVSADVPQLLNYQGRLTDTNGDPLNGPYSIQFLIYDVLTGGSDVWQETHSSVNVTDGVYQVLMGSVNPFPPDLFTSSIDRYLEIIVDGETLTPRTRFTSVSFALQTAHSDSADVAAFAVPVGPAAGDLTNNYPSPRVQAIQGQAVANITPATNEVLKWNGSAWEAAVDQTGGGSVWQTSGSNIYFDGGNVGIGTNGPSVPLQVVGTIIGSTFSGSGALLTDLNATNLATGTVPSARFGGTYTNAVTFSSATNSFAGIGTALTSLDATQLTTGAVPNGRLSGTYSGVLSLTNTSNTIAGNGSGLNSLNANALSSGTVADDRLETTINRTNFVASASISALDFITASGGVHVGGTSDPGTDNLIVDGDVSIGTTNSNAPLHVYSAQNDNATGLYIDHNGNSSGDTRALQIDHDNSGTGYTHGIEIDVNNTYTGNSWAYGIRSDVTNNGGTYGAQGIQSIVNGTSTGNKYGVYGSASGSGNNYGIRGVAGGSAINYGGWFSAQGGTEDFGVYASGDKHYFGGNVGIGTSTSLYPLHIVPGTATRGIYIDHNTTSSLFTYAVDARLINTGTNTTYGGYFSATNDNGSTNCYGIRGAAYGTSTGNKYGIYGYAGGTGNRYAGYFSGNVHVNGILSKSSGSFKIDHPLDPENKYLVHSFVESPDMMNVYNGNVVLANNGEAWVELPNYFETLNIDFRYQLTCIGGYAQVYIAEKVNNNRFKIAGGKSGLEVSWQVTGIRNDAYAQKNRIQVEEEKVGNERGKYLNPEVYGLPRTSAIDYDPSEEEEN